jgi:plasmid stabilization system protein ParE
MPRLVIAPEARQDLHAIRDYVAKDDWKAAHGFVTRLRDMARMLAAAPAIGRERPERIRSSVVDRYVLFYGPLLGAAGVELVRGLHGARGVDAIFSGDEH